MTPRQHKESEALQDKKAQKKAQKEDLVGWVGAVLVIFGYYLNAGELIECWPIWAVGNSCVGFYCLRKKAYPAMVMSCVLIILNIYGYFKWL